jgi:restriction system protein
MTRFWMVRAGEGGYLAEAFEQAGCVAIGWQGAGDFTPITTLAEMRQRLIDSSRDEKPGALANSSAMAFKFRAEMGIGHDVVTYDPSKREYLLGKITGEYEYAPGRVPDYNHVRSVKWEGRVSRDLLPASSKNTLGSTLGVFEPGEAVLADLRRAMDNPEEALPEGSEVESEDEWDVLRRDVAGKAHEFIKDRILSLAFDDVERLVAGLLEAMGYRARVTRKGPDRGRDIIASPDGLGLQEPRIMVEVKHRESSVGAPQVRSFLGGLRVPTRGLYVSTGGFTREAHYEAERASVPLTLLDLDELADLITDHYESFDLDARALFPLVRVYWPAS